MHFHSSFPSFFHNPSVVLLPALSHLFVGKEVDQPNLLLLFYNYWELHGRHRPADVRACCQLPMQKFLQAQSKIEVLAWVGLAALVAHIALLALFVSVLGWGMEGATAAYDASMALAQVAYVVGWC